MNMRFRNPAALPHFFRARLIWIIAFAVQNRGAVNEIYCSSRKNSFISLARASGCSMAAKCPGWKRPTYGFQVRSMARFASLRKIVHHRYQLFVSVVVGPESVNARESAEAAARQ